MFNSIIWFPVILDLTEANMTCNNYYHTCVFSTILILCFITIYFTRRRMTLPDLPHLTPQTSCYDNLTDILRARSLDNHIIVTIINYAYIELTIHWIYRLQRMNIHNFFVYLHDQQSLQYFHHHHLTHLCYVDPQIYQDNQSSYASWGSSSFKKIGNSKMFIANRILHLNYSVLISEIDVVWFQNPLPILKHFAQEFDVISQGITYTSPENRRNIGFVYLPCRESSIVIMNEVERILRADPSLWDQGVFNQVVDRAVKRKQIKDLLLDFKIFIFESFYLDPTLSSNDTIVAHLVGLDSAAHKTFVIKERAFSEDVFGYLSHPRKYLTYANPSIDPNQQVQALKKALHLSIVLNRTLILPRFHCHHINFYNEFYNMKLSSDCTAERFVDVQQLTLLYNIRENSFLRNPLVPKHIHQDRMVYNKTCDIDQPKKDTAIILDLGDLTCLSIPLLNITIHTCPPSNLHPTVLGYGPVCK